MDYKIREIKKEEYNLLENFLYESVFIPEGMEAPAKSIINNPDLRVYIDNFGKFKHDKGLVAEADGKNCRHCLGAYYE